MIDLDWEKQKADFEPDGSLRDIYVAGADLGDWAALFELASRRGDAELTRDGEVLPGGTRVADCFSDEATYLLRFAVGTVGLVAHFFDVGRIELDFMPHEVRSELELRAVLSFLVELGDLTQKRVLLTPENAMEHPLFSYDPEERRVRWRG